MQSVVPAIDRVTPLKQLINQASAAQAGDIARVSQPVIQMDPVTHAAPVEQAAAAAAATAAAKRLSGQAQQRVRAVSVFSVAPAGSR